jgi:hypothetical protein
VVAKHPAEVCIFELKVDGPDIHVYDFVMFVG